MEKNKCTKIALLSVFSLLLAICEILEIAEVITLPYFFSGGLALPIKICLVVIYMAVGIECILMLIDLKKRDRN